MSLRIPRDWGNNWGQNLIIIIIIAVTVHSPNAQDLTLPAICAVFPDAFMQDQIPILLLILSNSTLLARVPSRESTCHAPSRESTCHPRQKPGRFRVFNHFADNCMTQQLFLVLDEGFGDHSLEDFDICPNVRESIRLFGKVCGKGLGIPSGTRITARVAARKNPGGLVTGKRHELAVFGAASMPYMLPFYPKRWLGQPLPRTHKGR
mmetsp:Transcript_41927/g.75862  ORF Transcript_41927/g.75862 Transcript_41927/m.75862 type:complete len:207 (-) Transcript_41927:376-996(-)